MLDQSAAPGVMIISGRGSTAEPFAPFGNERFAQCSQPRIADCTACLSDELPISCLFCPQLRRALQQLSNLLFDQWANRPFARFQSKLTSVKLTLHLEKLVDPHCATCL